MAINQKNIMNSKLDVHANVRRLNLKKILTQAMGSAPVTGMIRSDIALKGTLAQPALDVKLNSPVLYGSTEIHDISVKLRAPEENHYTVNAGARIDDFKPEADIDLRNNRGEWTYRVDTKPLDIDKAIKTQAPDMAGIAQGKLTVRVTGSSRPSSDINVNASIPNLDVMDKLNIKSIILPVVYRPSVNKVELRNGSARFSNGQVNTGFEYDLTKANWKGNVKVAHLNFGDLANKFLPEGELVGSVDAEVSMKGQMTTSFATGKFSTTPGYFHKMELLETITPTKRVSFEKISGSFF